MKTQKKNQKPRNILKKQIGKKKRIEEERDYLEHKSEQRGMEESCSLDRGITQPSKITREIANLRKREKVIEVIW